MDLAHSGIENTTPIMIAKKWFWYLQLMCSSMIATFERYNMQSILICKKILKGETFCHCP